VARGDDQPAREAPELDVGRTRASKAWTASIAALVLALLMLIFIIQNGTSATMRFLWMEFTLPIGVGMLLASVVGGLVVTSLGVARLMQLRLAARRHRRADHA
jgi:uncharacterized integral membrane protein